MKKRTKLFLILSSSICALPIVAGACKNTTEDTKKTKENKEKNIYKYDINGEKIKTRADAIEYYLKNIAKYKPVTSKNGIYIKNYDIDNPINNFSDVEKILRKHFKEATPTIFASESLLKKYTNQDGSLTEQGLKLLNYDKNIDTETKIVYKGRGGKAYDYEDEAKLSYFNVKKVYTTPSINALGSFLFENNYKELNYGWGENWDEEEKQRRKWENWAEKLWDDNNLEVWDGDKTIEEFYNDYYETIKILPEAPRFLETLKFFFYFLNGKIFPNDKKIVLKIGDSFISPSIRMPYFYSSWELDKNIPKSHFIWTRQNYLKSLMLKYYELNGEFYTREELLENTDLINFDNFSKFDVLKINHTLDKLIYLAEIDKNDDYELFFEGDDVFIGSDNDSINNFSDKSMWIYESRPVFANHLIENVSKKNKTYRINNFIDFVIRALNADLITSNNDLLNDSKIKDWFDAPQVLTNEYVNRAFINDFDILHLYNLADETQNFINKSKQFKITEENGKTFYDKFMEVINTTKKMKRANIISQIAVSYHFGKSFLAENLANPEMINSFKTFYKKLLEYIEDVFMNIINKALWHKPIKKFFNLYNELEGDSTVSVQKNVASFIEFFTSSTIKAWYGEAAFEIARDEIKNLILRAGVEISGETHFRKILPLKEGNLNGDYEKIDHKRWNFAENCVEFDLEKGLFKTKANFKPDSHNYAERLAHYSAIQIGNEFLKNGKNNFIKNIENLITINKNLDRKDRTEENLKKIKVFELICSNLKESIQKYITKHNISEKKDWIQNINHTEKESISEILAYINEIKNTAGFSSLFLLCVESNRDITLKMIDDMIKEQRENPSSSKLGNNMMNIIKKSLWSIPWTSYDYVLSLTDIMDISIEKIEQTFLKNEYVLNPSDFQNFSKFLESYINSIPDDKTYSFVKSFLKSELTFATENDNKKLAINFIKDKNFFFDDMIDGHDDLLCYINPINHFEFFRPEKRVGGKSIHDALLLDPIKIANKNKETRYYYNGKFFKESEIDKLKREIISVEIEKKNFDVLSINELYSFYNKHGIIKNKNLFENKNDCLYDFIENVICNELSEKDFENSEDPEDFTFWGNYRYRDDQDGFLSWKSSYEDFIKLAVRYYSTHNNKEFKYDFRTVRELLPYLFANKKHTYIVQMPTRTNRYPDDQIYADAKLSIDDSFEILREKLKSNEQNKENFIIYDNNIVRNWKKDTKWEKEHNSNLGYLNEEEVMEMLKEMFIKRIDVQSKIISFDKKIGHSDNYDDLNEARIINVFEINFNGKKYYFTSHDKAIKKLMSTEMLNIKNAKNMNFIIIDNRHFLNLNEAYEYIDKKIIDKYKIQ